MTIIHPATRPSGTTGRPDGLAKSTKECSFTPATLRWPPATHDLPSGLYDQLVTLTLLRRLDPPELLANRPTANRQGLRPDTASEALSRHLFHLTSAVLSAVKGKPAEKLAKQLDLTNRLVSLLADLDRAVDADDHVTAELSSTGGPSRRDAPEIGQARQTLHPSSPQRPHRQRAEGPPRRLRDPERDRSCRPSRRVGVVRKVVRIRREPRCPASVRRSLRRSTAPTRLDHHLHGRHRSRGAGRLG
ncbi:MAG: hypothetical protein ACI9MC_004303 [Kiritimatiellia bacterium]|jgi:hypothetical protein